MAISLAKVAGKHFGNGKMCEHGHVPEIISHCIGIKGWQDKAHPKDY